MRLWLVLTVLALLAWASPAGAVITPPTLVIDGSSSTDSTSTTTGNISPTANKFHLVAVASRLIGTPNEPELTGCSMTWDQIQTGTVASAYRLTFFRGVSATPGTDCGLTADFGGQTQLDTWIFVYEWPDAKITGTNGSDGIVQAPAADNEGGVNVTAASITLAAFADATNNAAFGCWTHGSGVAPIPGAGFTILGDTPFSSRRFTCEYKQGEDTTVDISWSSTGLAVGIAVEVAAEVATGVAGPLINSTPLKTFVGGGLAP